MFNTSILCLGCISLIFGFGNSAKADMTIITSGSVKNSQMAAEFRKMSSQQKLMMRSMMANSGMLDQVTGTPQVFTTFIKGSRKRIDMKRTSVVYDRSARTAFALNPTTHIFTMLPIHDVLAELEGSSSSKQSAGQDWFQKGCKLRETGQTKIINGYVCRHYLTSQEPLSDKTKTSETNSVWICPHIPKISSSSDEKAALKKLLSPDPRHPGLVLLIESAITDPQDGRTDIRIATELSTAPLAASLFTIPAGYTEEKTAVAPSVKQGFTLPSPPTSPPHTHINNALMQAVDDENEANVRQALAQGASPNSRDEREFSALTLASYQGDLSLVKMLIQQGASVTLQDGKRNTPLGSAVFMQKSAVAAYLLDHGADVNGKGAVYDTVLMEAAQNDDTVMINLLLAHGADINKRSYNNATALSTAAQAGRQEALKLLLKRGAQTQGDEYGLYALTMAAQFKQPATAQILLDFKVAVNPLKNNVQSPLMAAAEAGQTELVQLLLDKGAGINWSDENGVSALMLATLSQTPACVQALLEKGADVNQKATAEDIVGMTALLYAAREGQTAMVRLLLAHGADLNTMTGAGETALTLADGHPEVIALLKSAGEKK